ncbi:MAG: cytochrome b N-terminal domain-containing protein [candidate division WOR-3 bacterium]
MTRLFEWINDRLGIRESVRKILDEPIPGGARLAYVFGSGLVFLFLLQAVTGVFLTMYYVPSADHAHVSVAYIQKVVTTGKIVRGLHYYGASAMLLILIAHFVQTYVSGAYKGKRELLWMVGVLMIPLIVGFAFTGYLLPWDQEAYFGTKVGMSVLSEIPVIGEPILRILVGGTEVTTLTLSRFFVTHIFLLPLLLSILVIVHLILFRRAGPAGPLQLRENARVERFHPHQLFKDMTFIFVIFLVLLILAIEIPAPLGPQADPTQDFLARPPWYFLWLFQLLKYFPGTLSMIPTLIVPTILLGLIFLLPFLDKRPERSPLLRPTAMVLLAVGLFACLSLTVLSKFEDGVDPQISAKLRLQSDEARGFQNAPFVQQEIGRSIPIEPSTIPNPAAISSRVLRLYFANCADCHGGDATGGPMAPSLVRLAKKRGRTVPFLVGYLSGHEREVSPGSMPRFTQMAQEDKVALAEWLLNLNEPIPIPRPSVAAATSTPIPAAPATAEKGTQAAVPTPAGPPPPKAYLALCSLCHGNVGQGNIGPPLLGMSSKPNRTVDDLIKILMDSRQYGLKDPMPASFPMLSDDERREIAEWVWKLK